MSAETLTTPPASLPEPRPGRVHAAAYRADSKPVSREAFYALACDPRRSVVVEACAGAGKTWMLVSRILRALLGGAEPHEILAITFTRKAAGEMRQRLNDWLREFASPELGADARIQALLDRGVAPAQARELAPALAGLHEKVLRAGRPVEVRTFHAWFSQLLRAAPIDLLNELGLQGDMELIEDLSDHRANVFRRFHAALLREPALQADHALLIAQRGRSQARKWFEAALDKRVEFELADAAGVLEASVAAPADHWPELASSAADHPAELLRAPAWRGALGELMQALGNGGGAKTQEAARGLALALALPDDADPAALFDAVWSALFTKSGTPRKLGSAAQLAPLQSRLEALASHAAQHHAHLEHLRLVRLVRVLLAEYAAYKRARGLADMADLERCGLALLRDASLSGWVQERLDARIRHVLIDEFQDTSPLQWQALLAWLSSYAGAGGGQSGQSPPGVFIVGDPKQSIYRFRRAEPKVFAAAREFVAEQLGGRVLACDHTRRNALQVLEAVNGVFGRAQGAAEFDGFRPHTTDVADPPGAGLEALPIVPRPPRAEVGEATGAAAEAAPLLWRDTLTTPRREADEVLREREAAHVAAAVQQLVRHQGVRPAEIFILSRKRQSLRLAAAALRRLHLPYAAVEDFLLLAAPEARDLIAVLDVLGSPQHRLSLAQALRSPLFGASDDDLISLARRADGARGDWWLALISQPHESPALQRASRLLRRWHADVQRLPPHDLLDRIVAEGELRERVAATVPPEQRIAALDAVDAVLGQALTLNGARYATPYNLVRALRRRKVKVAAPSQPDAVQLLTVHGAKGLEARVVFVMDAEPEARTADNAVLLVDWPVDAEHPTRCAFVYSETHCPPSLAKLLEGEIAARQREELNGLYVAMTRARERLVFSATQPHRRAPAASWWRRIEAHARPWAPVADAPPDGPRQAVAPALLKVLPPWRPEPAADAGAASPEASAAAASAPDSDPTALEQAVRRVLGWAGAVGPNPVAAVVAAPPDLDALATAAAARFRSSAAEVRQIAAAILHAPACAAFFFGPALQWAGNDVAMAAGGEVLRIDRLVQLQTGDGPLWWVLGYRLQHAPGHRETAADRQQLLGQRDAVRRAQPGARVRCAVVTGAGELVEIDDA